MNYQKSLFADQARDEAIKNIQEVIKNTLENKYAHIRYKKTVRIGDVIKGKILDKNIDCSE